MLLRDDLSSVPPNLPTHPWGLLALIAMGSMLNCKSNESSAAEEPVQPALPQVSPDAQPAPLPSPPAAPLGTHLDGTGAQYNPSAGHAQRLNLAKKTIELTLRSSPPGAIASIDGKRIGITPTFWSGQAGHQSHDFTFVKAGYAMARYRFVATKSGIVHGSLTPLVPSEAELPVPSAPAK